MRRVIIALGIVAIGPRVGAGEVSDLLAKAAKVTAGSDETLAKRKYMAIRQTGVIYLPNGAAISARECTFALPDRAKWAGDMRQPTGAIPFVVVLSGFGGWSKLQGQLADLSPRQYEGLQNEAHTLWLAFALPRTSRSIVWSLEADSKVDGRATRTLKAVSPGKAAVTLSLDKETGLVLKAAYSGTESNLPVTKEYIFSGHKDFDGQRLPAKVQVTQNGRKIEEWTNDSFRFPAKLPDKEFAKP